MGIDLSAIRAEAQKENKLTQEIGKEMDQLWAQCVRDEPGAVDRYVEAYRKMLEHFDRCASLVKVYVEANEMLRTSEDMGDRIQNN